MQTDCFFSSSARCVGSYSTLMIASTKGIPAFEQTVVTRSLAVPSSTINNPISNRSTPPLRSSQPPISMQSSTSSISSINSTIHGAFTEQHSYLSTSATVAHNDTATVDESRGYSTRISTQSSTLPRYALNYFFIEGPVIYVDFSMSPEDGMNVTTQGKDAVENFEIDLTFQHPNFQKYVSIASNVLYNQACSLIRLQSLTDGFPILHTTG
jgi:hypothetical protein